MKKHVHMIVDGRVQGVGFRHYTQLKAMEYSINGWVRNRDDQKVEIDAEGEESNIQKFIEEIKKGPSPFASVSNVEVKIVNTPSHTHSFRVKYS
ncbi:MULTISPECIES: acylphosphatase [Priestia]|uniref:acylphosphatase n=1 Tax=Priestia TaxID=2800373 RepID=UPI0004727D8C|nr:MULTISPECIES: acylphosphatase [Priestia]TCN10028.1 acylphosphatase [Bacillus sp. BK006]MCM3018363.1 acylphosphatase [Priestia megaterium]MCM3184823.1 acylphosphatase [Priestia megaterium]MCM3195258.1 acylphosphatase [Priestia megaterium]MCM3793218.1 acylphosphatase [Priestia megaterium]